MPAHTVHWIWEVCHHCLPFADPRQSAKQEDQVPKLFPLFRWSLQLRLQHYLHDYDPYFMFADGQILESPAPR